MLFSPSSGLVSCPLAMTDGAAFTLREFKRSKSPFWCHELENAYERLISSDPKLMWTSGQWMTEKRGGSDVSFGTDTFALPIEGNRCQLYGYKWFSSATDSDMSLALARFPQTEKDIEARAGKLGLVFLRIRDDRGQLNDIEIVRLKDKLGTR
jgi:alkylation response protein AidB-like acyl-CoA dehydrogenase